MVRPISWRKAYAFSFLLHIAAAAVIVFACMNAARHQEQHLYVVELGMSEAAAGEAAGHDGGLRGDPAAFPEPLDKELLKSRLESIQNTETVSVLNDKAVYNNTAVLEHNGYLPAGNTAAEAASGSANANKGNGTGSAEGDASGQGTGTGSGAGSGTVPGEGNGAAPGSGSGGGGVYTAMSADGIDYTILRDAEARYPEEARSIGYAKTVPVTGKVLVGLDGSIEDVKIMSSVPDLGFREAAEQALWQMRFAPVYYQGQNIKMYCEKTIHFQP